MNLETLRRLVSDECKPVKNTYVFEQENQESFSCCFNDQILQSWDFNDFLGPIELTLPRFVKIVECVTEGEKFFIRESVFSRLFPTREEYEEGLSNLSDDEYYQYQEALNKCKY